jgi:hypothetical protein
MSVSRGGMITVLLTFEHEGSEANNSSADSHRV